MKFAKKIILGLLIFILVLWTPYFIKINSLKTLMLEDIPAEGAWAPLEMGNLFYRWYYPDKEASNNEIIILVHGFSTPHFVWDEMREFFTNAGYTLLVYDHFGRGFSERPLVTYDQNLYVESLKGLLDHLDISQPINLVGYSMGGPVVGYFSLQYPHSVKSISLIAPAGFMKENSIDGLAVMPIAADWFWQLFGKSLYLNEVQNESTNIDDRVDFSGSNFVTKFSIQMEYRGFIEALLSTVRNFDLFDAMEMFEDLGRQKIPTIAIWGTDDGVVPFVGSKKLMQSLPHASLEVIDQGKHDIAYANPSKVALPIINFLSQEIKSQD